MNEKIKEIESIIEKKDVKLQYMDQVNCLPTMNIHIRKATVDFETLNIEFSCSGFNMEECKSGIDYLIKKKKEIEDLLCLDYIISILLIIKGCRSLLISFYWLSLYLYF